LAARYLDQADDLMLSRQVQIYERVWPFGRLVSLLSQSEERSASWAADVVRNLRACLQTYGWSPPAVRATLEDAEAWAEKLGTQVASDRQ
jgi:hypothetical protein